MSRSAAPAAPEVLVVVNPAAARYVAAGGRELIETHLASRGLRHAILEFAPGEAALGELARAIAQAVRSGCRRVVVAGGDGSVSWIATTIASLGKNPGRPMLAIVPVGTANIMARELGLPMDPAAALEVALDGEDTLELDAIRTPSGLCLTQVGVGADSLMIDGTSREDQKRRGRWAYFKAFLDKGVSHPAQDFEFTVDGRRIRARAWQVMVANSGVAGTPPFMWGPGIDPSDGVLDLCVFAAQGPRDVLKLAWRLMTADRGRSSRARYFKVTGEVTIRTKQPQLVQGDGEIIGSTPITLRVERHAIRAVVSRSLADVPSVVGAPGDSASGAAIAEASEATVDGEHTVAHDVDVMVSLHSRSWALQGWFVHPFTKVAALDAALFLKVNGLALGKRADTLLVMLSNWMHLGEGWAVVAVIIVVQDLQRGMRVSVEALLVLWLTMLTVNFPLKRLFRRERPFVQFVDARIVGRRPRDFSFPSGHSAAAFAGALLFGSHLPLWSPVFYTLACLVGFSRVYLGVHYPSDVLLGGLVGTALAIAYRAWIHRWLPGLG